MIDIVKTLEDGLIRPYIARAKRGDSGNQLPDAIPTDPTLIDRRKLPVLEVPTSWVHFDADVHPFIKPGAPARHVGEILSGEEPVIAVAPAEDGRLKVVKGHDTLLAAKMLGLPKIHVVLVAPTPAEGAAQAAIGHFFPRNDEPVPAAVSQGDVPDRVRSVVKGLGLPERLPEDTGVRGRLR